MGPILDGSHIPETISNFWRDEIQEPLYIPLIPAPYSISRILKPHISTNRFLKNIFRGKQSQDGGGIGQGDLFCSHKFIKRSSECWATSTKQLLNAGGVHQAPRKAAHSLRKEVGQNIKDRNRDKRFRDGDLTWGESVKEEKFPHSRKPSHRWVCGEFCNLRGKHNWEKKKKKNPTEYTPNHNCQHHSSPDACVYHQSGGWAGRTGQHHRSLG